MVYVAYALKKTISEILQSETMARFRILSQLLPKVEYAHSIRMQQALHGMLPPTFEEYMEAASGATSSDLEISDLSMVPEIQDGLADLLDLKRRSSDIASKKGTRH